MYYLYVKQHNETGLKYFGVTQKLDPFKYTGSGKRWLKHLRKHGKLISTIEIWGFDNIKDCKEFALRFSTKNQIVQSEQWANLIDENGTDGNPPGILISEETRQKHRDRTGIKNGFFGKTHSQTTKDKWSISRKGVGRPHTDETKLKIGMSNKNKLSGRKLSEETRDKMSAASKKTASKPITLNGVIYPSIKDACIATGISRYMLLKLKSEEGEGIEPSTIFRLERFSKPLRGPPRPPSIDFHTTETEKWSTQPYCSFSQRRSMIFIET